MSDRFSLDQIREGVGKRREELNKEAEPHSVEDETPDNRRPVSFEHSDYDRTEAPKDQMRKYWRQFETTPIIRKPITSFASRVTEPGYYIEAENLDQEEIKEIGRWLKKAAIIEGQPGKDFRLLAKKAIIQREVRGTALIEKAPHKDDENKVAGLKLINPEVCESVTRPQQNILLAPDDGERFPEAPDAETGGKAAWLQDVIDARETDWGVSDRINSAIDDDADDDMKIGFRRDEIVPLTRDADVGEVFGTSRIEAVSPRIEGLKQKLDDNDKAIESKAYPLWLFLFGDPETTGVWDSSLIDEFMNSHEMDNFHPGMKQGVRGDVSVETISGEVSEIGEYLDFDIQWIMSSMPMPMFALGSFADSGGAVGQVAGVAQQQNVARQIKEARLELEEEFTPVIQQIAKQRGIDEERAKGIRLRFGDPKDPNPEVKRSQQVIRYESDAKGGRGGVRDPQESPRSDQDQNNTDIESNPFTSTQEKSTTEQIDSEYSELWDTVLVSEELSDNNGQKEKLADKIFNVFRSVRDNTLERVSKSYDTTPKFAAIEFENIANSQLNNSIRSARLRKESKNTFTDLVREIERDYGNSQTKFSQQQNARFYAQSFENAVRDASEEMLRRARVLVRDGVVSGEQWSDVRERVEDNYDDAELRNRANLIAHMEIKRSRETTKLQQFESNSNIVGVRVHNPNASARVTDQLHGAEAYFGQGEIDNQLAQQVSSDALREGFDPLPRTPPYHFQDTTSLEPIYADDR